jgi:hypothetical protein
MGPTTPHRIHVFLRRTFPLELNFTFPPHTFYYSISFLITFSQISVHQKHFGSFHLANADIPSVGGAVDGVFWFLGWPAFALLVGRNRYDLIHGMGYR